MLEKDYELCRPYLSHIALRLHYKTGFDYKELVSKANELFVESWYTYDPDEFPNTKLTTYVTSQVTPRLRNYVFRRDPMCQDDEWHGDRLHSRHPEWHPRKRLELKETIDGMSEEAKFVVSVILDCPAEILELDGTEKPKTIRGALVRYLRESGWAWSLIWDTFKEVKTTVARM